MAGELELVYPVAAASLYAVIRRRSDGYVWNGTAFEVWANGNIATYDIALTDAGGDIYRGDFPATIPAGNHRIVYYLMAGAAPAIGDTILATKEQSWNGVALVDASVVTLSPYALTTVVKVKRYLHITATTWDDLLTELINAWTDRLERLGGRKFAARSFTENYGGKGTMKLIVDNYPVNSITSLYAVYNAGSEETTSEILDEDYRLDGDRGIIELIGNRWSNWEAGTFSKGFRNYRITYNGGYATIPDDLDMLCRELVSESFNLSRRDTSIKSESLGDYSYTLADAITLSDSQWSRLRRWAEVPIGAGV